MEENDVFLCVDGRRFSCNRRLLSEKSQYFRGMFESQMKEACASIIELKETDAVAMEIIINFIKTSHLKITQNNIQKVLEMSCMYQVQEVADSCCQYLVDNLSVDNSLSTMILADFLSLNRLYNKARHHVLWFFGSVVKTAEFLELSETFLVDIICDEQLNIDNELYVIEAISMWVHHEKENRLSRLSEILCNSHYQDYLSKDDLEKLQNQTTKENIVSCEILKNCVGKKEQAKRLRSRPEVLLSIETVKPSTSTDENGSTSFLHIWDKQTETLQKEQELPLLHPDLENRDTGFKICVNGEQLFVSGGEAKLGRNSWYWDLWCYNALDGTWRVLSRLQQPRRHHAMCSLGDDSILLIGGLGKYRIKLDSVESYNYKQDSWNTLASMPEADFSQAVCECQKKIYAFKSQTYCYNPVENKWSQLFSIPTDFQFNPSSAVAIGNDIYLTSSDSPSMICYNIQSDLYMRVGDYAHTDIYSNAVLFENCIYQLQSDGIDDEQESCFMEWYDIKNSQFHSVRLQSVPLVKSFLLVLPAFRDFRV